MRPLVVNVVELLRAPGTDRRVQVELTAEELGVRDPRVDPAETIAVDLHLESLTDGIVVTGSVRAPWHDECSRCLTPVSGTVEAAVDEIYRVEPDDESFPITGDQIDFAPMARELVMLTLPVAPVCREDCAGICPSCGADRNEVDCGCVVERHDDRWAALDALREQLK